MSINAKQIAKQARSMSSEELADWVREDAAYVANGVSRRAREEAQIRLDAFRAEQARRSSGGNQIAGGSGRVCMTDGERMAAGLEPRSNSI